jgi:hypothetical protein
VLQFEGLGLISGHSDSFKSKKSNNLNITKDVYLTTEDTKKVSFVFSAGMLDSVSSESKTGMTTKANTVQSSTEN